MFLELDNPSELKKQIENLQPTSGVCIFIDICGSTAIKQENLQRWILLIGNTIRLCGYTFPLFRENILKLIGDEIMIFIPDENIEKVNENYGTILDFLKNCISSWGETIDSFSMSTKASIHYCTDTYNISFSRTADDYYGNDIDFTARLMKKAEERKIILSEVYYQKVLQIDRSYLNGTSDELRDEFKGIGISSYRLLAVQ